MALNKQVRGLPAEAKKSKGQRESQYGFEVFRNIVFKYLAVYISLYIIKNFIN